MKGDYPKPVLLTTLDPDVVLRIVQVVIDPAVRGLCCRPYDLHPLGCPNYGKRETCPPKARLYGEVYDLTSVYVVVTKFDLAAHVARMRASHPDWSDRQLRCVLYWQNGARKRLSCRIAEILKRLHGYRAETCPEAMGVNVTETLRTVGVELEWPPIRIVRQVALLGIPKQRAKR
jgi:predicted metal-binding protein